MENKKLKEKCSYIERLLKEDKIQQAQIEIEELKKRINIIECLNSCWGTWRTDLKQKPKLELNSELEELKKDVIVLNENFEKNIKDLKEYDIKAD